MAGAGTVLENLSGRKLSVLVGVLLVCQVICFLIGGLIAPSPSGTQGIIATVCRDNKTKRTGLNDFFTRECDSKMNLQDSANIPGLTPNELVFVVQLPSGTKNDFSRWHQNLIGVLDFDLQQEQHMTVDPVIELALDVKLGYQNKGSDKNKWELLAHSVETRYMDCTAESDNDTPMLPGFSYVCSTVPLFELGSLHHDYYLLNMRLPIDGAKNNLKAQISDVTLHIIFMNGGFTRVWLGLKTFFFPCIVAVTFWFWRRVHILSRTPALLEYMLVSLGGGLVLLDLPLEYLTLYFDMPYMLLLNDIRLGVFYALLLSFWVIFAGEHMLIKDGSEQNSIKKYWKHLSAIIVGCVSLLVFDLCERGVQLRNPFYTIWITPVGTNLALAFIILAGISASIYFIFLCYMIWKVFGNISIKRAALPNMSSARRLHYEGIIYRFNFLMIATLICAAVTVITFIFDQVDDNQHNWDDDIEHVEVSSAMCTGVYGMWNVYILAMLMLYAPSHKQWPTDPVCGEHGEEVEFSRLHSDPSPSEISSLTSFASKATID